MNGCVYRTADNQCEKFSDPVRNTLSWCVGDTPCEARKLSNADRIRMMSDEELAEMLYNIDGDENWDGVPVMMIMGHAFLDECEVLEWLRKEAEDG